MSLSEKYELFIFHQKSADWDHVLQEVTSCIPLYTICISFVYPLYTLCIPFVNPLYTLCIPFVYPLQTIPSLSILDLIDWMPD